MTIIACCVYDILIADAITFLSAILNFLLIQRNFEVTELDLSEFICKEVNISFAVINEHGVSDFSPSRTFCIAGKLAIAS